MPQRRYKLYLQGYYSVLRDHRNKEELAEGWGLREIKRGLGALSRRK